MSKATAAKKKPILIYLDSSDYSRFGDVIRGKSDPATESIFNELLSLKSSGKAVFAYSVTVLSELFQYNPAFPDTTQAKAQAVEMLCGKTAFYWPMRAIAYDVANYCGLKSCSAKPLSFRSEWYPCATAEIVDLKGALEAQLAGEFSSRSYGTRAERRRVEARLRKFRFDIVAPPVIDFVASTYQLDRQEVAKAITPTLQGKISSSEGARRMFDAIARPTAFARAYFSDINSDQNLPNWISGVGNVLQNSLIEMREKLKFCSEHDLVNQLPVGVMLSSNMILLAIAKQAELVYSEFSSGRDLSEVFNSIDSLLEIPSLNLFFHAYKILVEQAAGIHGAGHEPERSAFGDLIHLIYLPHVDLWRCDRRFRSVVSKISGRFDQAVVNKLSDLPARIAAA